MHLRSAGVILYLKDSTDNSVRSATFDLDGELTDTANISGNALVNAEIRSSGDINNDNHAGAVLGDLLFTPTTNSGGNPQRYVYDSNQGLILFRNQPAPVGPDNQLSIQSSSFDINGYDGPSIVAVDKSVSLESTEAITAARVTRSPIGEGSHLTLADGFEIYIANENTNAVRVVKFNLDGSFASTHSRSVDQTVGIIITPVNDSPIQSGSKKLDRDAIEDESYTLTAAELLQGITDVDEGDTINISGVVSADHGSILKNEDETYTYKPEDNYNGNVTFSFIASDGKGGSVDANQTLVIRPENDDPIQTADYLESNQTFIYTLTEDQLLKNFNDVDSGDTLQIDGAITVDSGTLESVGNNEYRFTPNNNYSGDVKFSFNVKDNNGGSVRAVQKLTVGEIQESQIQTLQAQLSDLQTSLQSKTTSYNRHKIMLLQSRVSLNNYNLISAKHSQM